MKKDGLFVRKVVPQSFAIAIGILIFSILTDVFGVISGQRDFDGYLEIRNYLRTSEDSNAMYFSSDFDFFEFNSSENSMKEFSGEFATSFYNDVKSAASFGAWYFNKFLMEKSITHLIVPENTSRKSIIEFKWGQHGNINIPLKSPFFEKLMTSSGPNPITLYKVKKSARLDHPVPTYELVWDQYVRKDFYSPITRQSEVGQYSYRFKNYYLNGRNISWVYGNSKGASEPIAFHVKTDHQSKSKFNVEIFLQAAYGSFAPPQTVIIKAADAIYTKVVKANQPQKVNLILNSDDRVEVISSLPCQSDLSFDPTAKENAKFCFGISKIVVYPIS